MLSADARRAALSLLHGEALHDAVGGELAAAFARLRVSPLEQWPRIVPRFTLDELAPWLRFDRAKHTRVLLAADGATEAILTGWLPDQESPIHDHGGSKGMTRVIVGEGIERRFVARDGGTAQATRETRIRAGDCLFTRGEDVHSIVNAGPGLLVTLHVHSPRLVGFATYDAPPRDGNA